MKYVKLALFLLAILGALVLGFCMKSDNTIVIKTETIQTFKNVPQWMIEKSEKSRAMNDI